MADAIVGRVGIRVKPETTDFAKELKAKLEALERQLKIKVPVVVDDSSLNRLKAKLKGMDETVRVKVDVDDVSMNRLSNRLKNLAKDAKIKIDFEAGDLKATERLLKAFRDKQMGGLDTDALTDSLRNVKTTITADADTALAETQLDTAARDRISNLTVKVNDGGNGGKNGGFLNFASNFNEMNEFTRTIGKMLSTVSLAVPKLMLIGAAVGGLGGIALAAVSNVSGLVSSLGQLIPLGLTLPGILTGFGVGFGSLIAVLKDAPTVLADLGPAFSRLQDSMSSAYWERAAQPIRDMVNTLLPALHTPLREISGQLGQMTLGMAKMFSEAANVGRMVDIFENVRDSIDIAGDGVVTMGESILRLSQFGATYLPRLASYFNMVSFAFENWLDINLDNGNMQRWVETSIQAWKDLGRILVETVRFFGHVGDAAQRAGGLMNLGQMADGMERMNKALGGAMWQGGLTRWFEAGHRAMEGMGEGLATLGRGLYDLSFNIGDIVGAAGESFGELLGILGKIIGHPAVAGGLENFFTGIRDGLAGLSDSMPAFGSILGNVLDVAGELARTVGPTLGAAFEVLAPVFDALADALLPAIQYLGENLPDAIRTVLGPLGELVANDLIPTIADFVGRMAEKFQELGEAAGPQLAELFPQMVEIFSQLVTDVLPPLLEIFEQLIPIMGEFATEVLPHLVTLAGVVMDLLGPALEFVSDIMESHMVPAMESLIDMITGLIDGFMWLFETAEMVGEFLGQGLLLALYNLVVAWGDLNQAIEDVKLKFEEFGVAVETMVAIVSEQLQTAVIEWFTGMVTEVQTGLETVRLMFENLPMLIEMALGMVGEFLGQLAYQWMMTMAINIGTGVGTVMNWFYNLPIQIESALVSVGNIMAVQGALWFNNLRNSVIVGIASVIAYFATMPSRVTTAISVIASILSTQAATWFATLRAGVISGIASVIAYFATMPGRVTASIASIAGILAMQGMLWLNSLRNSVGRGISGVIAYFATLPGRITATLQALPGQLLTIGIQMIQGLINGIKSMAGTVATAARSVVQGAVDAARNALDIRSPSRVFMKIGAYSGEGLAKGLSGSTKQVKKAASDLAKALSQQYVKTFPNAEQFQRIVGVSREQGSKNFYRNHVAKDVAILTQYATTQDKLTERIKKANDKLKDVLKDYNQYKDSLADKFANTFSLGNLADENGAADLSQFVAHAKDALAQIKEMGKNLDALGKKGVPKDLINEIAQMGAEAGNNVAKSLLNGPSSELKDLVKTYSAIQKESDKSANAAARQMYGAGVNSAQGFINGLNSQLKALDKAAGNMAAKLILKIQTYLGIRSPSRVMMQLGYYTAEGFRVGLDGQSAKINQAMVDMVKPPSVPGMSGPSLEQQAVAGGIQISVQARADEDPTQLGRRVGEAFAREIGVFV